MIRRPLPASLLLWAFALAYAGAVIGYLPLLSLLLPLKIARIAGEARIDLLTVTVIAGALVASVANIAFGWLSDRSLARGGGRRRWITLGAVGLTLSYAMIASAEGAPALIAAVLAFQISINAILAPLTAIMADEIPAAQRGLAGGSLALGPPLAGAVSALLVAIPALGEGVRLALVAVIAIVALAPLLLLRAGRAQDVTTAAPPPTIPPRDLVIASIARLLVQVAGSALSLYLLFFFQSIARDVEPETLAGRVGTLLTLGYILPLPVAMIAGRRSDRAGRRKPFLLATALLAAGGLSLMAASPDPGAASLGYLAYAIGTAVFLSLHAAFAIQLLPDPRHRGRDLGLLNLTNTLPSLLGPLLTWLLATPHDFTPLLVVLAAITLVGGAAILPLHPAERPTS